MEEWKEYRLGDICKTNQNSYSLNYGWSFVNYLDTGNITENKISEIQFIDLTKEDLPSRAKRKVSTNSIIYSTVRPNQKHFGIIKTQPENFLVSTGFAVLDIDTKIADPDFVYYNLIQNDNTISLHAIAEQTTSAYPAIKPSDIENLSIKLPPLPIQQKIATILSSLDDKIELNNKINTNLEQQAQALFDEMFKDYEKDILLGDVIETTSGGTPSRKNMAFYTNGNNCWVKSKELESGFIIDTEEKITEDAINNSAAKLIPANSVLIAMYGATVGAYGIISKPMTCNQAICALLPNENYPYTYLFMFAKNITQELENLAIGSAQQNISQVLIKKLKVHSDTNKIKEFHSSTHALFEQMLLIRQENKTLSELRDALLPKLMKGEIKVDEVRK